MGLSWASIFKSPVATPTHFNARGQYPGMTFTGRFVETETRDGLTLQGLHAPADADVAVLHVHGMAGNLYGNSFVKEMLASYPDSGIGFLTVELRGSETMRLFERGDDWVTIGNAYERFADSALDIAAWVAFLSDYYDEIWLQAHSLGPSKVAQYLADDPHPSVAGAIFISPSEMRGLVLAEDCPEHDRLISEAAELVDAGEEDALLSEQLWGWATLSAGTYLDLFGPDTDAAVFPYSHDDADFTALAQVDVPILAFLGTADDGIAVPAADAMQQLESHLASCPRFEGVVLDGAEHDYEGFEEEIVEKVVGFLYSSAGG